MKVNHYVTKPVKKVVGTLFVFTKRHFSLGIL